MTTTMTRDEIQAEIDRLTALRDAMDAAAEAKPKTLTPHEVADMIQDLIVGDCIGEDAHDLIDDAPETWMDLRDEMLEIGEVLPRRVSDRTYRRALAVLGSRY